MDEKWIDAWVDGQMEGWRDGGMEGWRDGKFNGQLNGWIDVYTYTYDRWMDAWII